MIIIIMQNTCVDIWCLPIIFKISDILLFAGRKIRKFLYCSRFSWRHFVYFWRTWILTIIKWIFCFCCWGFQPIIMYSYAYRYLVAIFVLCKTVCIVGFYHDGFGVLCEFKLFFIRCAYNYYISMALHSRIAYYTHFDNLCIDVK